MDDYTSSQPAFAHSLRNSAASHTISTISPTHSTRPVLARASPNTSAFTLGLAPPSAPLATARASPWAARSFTVNYFQNKLSDMMVSRRRGYESKDTGGGRVRMVSRGGGVAARIHSCEYFSPFGSDGLKTCCGRSTLPDCKATFDCEKALTRWYTVDFRLVPVHIAPRCPPRTSTPPIPRAAMPALSIPPCRCVHSARPSRPHTVAAPSALPLPRPLLSTPPLRLFRTPVVRP
ncbi:hypothetical protein DFH08DRAFT_968939 [Mycena albidolilacea]|uniref:Uncharacterized protein n=1 Tax=Mycena albidolilacea TaxID=1033008 RepID=A0AAD6ZJ11_9AGAR|nr:hypothetical protein DFH08DRAFT_968939 [Mycena albidolilacea]